MNSNDIISGFSECRHEGIEISSHPVADIDNCALVTFVGYLDSYNAAYYLKYVSAIVEKGYVWLIFDCERLTYISSAFDNFWSVKIAVMRRNGDLVIQKMSPGLLEIYDLLGFSQYFIFTKTLEESIAVLKLMKETLIFPHFFSCPSCGKRYQAHRPGRFHCGECSAGLIVDEDGHASTDE